MGTKVERTAVLQDRQREEDNQGALYLEWEGFSKYTESFDFVLQ